MAYFDYSKMTTEELKNSLDSQKRAQMDNPPPPFAKGKEIVIPFLPRP